MINNLSTDLSPPVDNFADARAKSAYGGSETAARGGVFGLVRCRFRPPSRVTNLSMKIKNKSKRFFLILTRHRYKLKPMHFALGLDYLVARLERVFYWPVGQQLRTAGVQAYKNPLYPLKSQKTGQGGLL